MSIAKKIHQSGLVLAYGELLWDLLPTGAVVGGAPANFAFRMSSFGQKALTISRIGNDKLGADLLKELESRNIDCSLIQRDSQHPTGTVDVRLSERGDATYTINKGVAYDFIELTPTLKELAQAAAVLYYGSLIQRHSVSRDSLHELISCAPQAIKVLDLNLRKDCFTTATVRQSIELANVLKLNDDEAREVGSLLEFDGTAPERFAEQIMRRFDLDACIVTKGIKGAYARANNGQEAWSPGYDVKVADTVGSGDSFTAAFIHKYLAGASLAECCEFGNRIGALVAGKTGGMCPIGPDEIEGFCLKARAC